MKIIQVIRDLFAKFFPKHLVANPFSKHFWRADLLEFYAHYCGARYRGYASVDAKKLEELCGHIYPSYTQLVQRVQNAIGGSEQLHDDYVIGLFYRERKQFMVELKKILMSPIVTQQAINLYEELEKFYSSAACLARFENAVKKARLEGHVMLRDNGTVIKFTNIKVQGDVKLNLNGHFDGWEFHRVKFCNNVAVSIYSTVEDCIWHILFSENVCYGKFSCNYALDPYVVIRDSVFKSSVKIRVGLNGEEDALPGWITAKQDSYRVKSSEPSIVEFSGNYVKESLSIYDSLFRSDRQNIEKIRFANGNAVGRLSIPDLWMGQGTETLKCNKALQKVGSFIDDIHFGVDEHINLPSSREEAMDYKNYFIALKNRAIKKRDREAEFNYGRKERYFERGITTRWQDKFPLWWSHTMSDDGISWIRPTLILLGGHWILAAIFIGGFGGCGGWLIATVESLNPLSSLEDIVKSPCCEKWMDSLSASIYNAVRRIFSLALLYEIIKVLRRFSNKLSSG